MSKIDEKVDQIGSKIDQISEAIHKVDKDLAVTKSSFEEHTKQDESMYAELKRMNDILQQNTESLKEHMSRTELLESIMEKMDARLSPLEVKHIQSEAVKNWLKDRTYLMAKVVGALAALSGAAAVVKALVTHFIH